MAAQQTPVYDRIGQQYRAGRHEDPRIAAALWAALGAASPVLNVGGTSSTSATGSSPPGRVAEAQ
jgi:hypothetical protein